MTTEDFCELQKEFFELWKEFSTKAKKNLEPKSSEFFDEILEEVEWQISDWYHGESYYAKPEDILVDFFFLTPKDAHRFLPLFITKLRGDK